ncbi:MAG: hypothetical protein ABSF59_18045 [Candidatus Sulfotelmatobacter sp.]
MSAASVTLCSTNCNTIAASSIHGTGAHNLSIILRKGWSATLGMEFGPTAWRRLLASCVVSPDLSADAALDGLLAEFRDSAEAD